MIVALTDGIAQAIRAATETTPIVWIGGGGDPTEGEFARSLARPGGNITGVTVNAGPEIFGKRLQILKEAVPSVSKVAWLTTRTTHGVDEPLHEAGRRLQISVIDIVLEDATPPGVASGGDGVAAESIIERRLPCVPRSMCQATCSCRGCSRGAISDPAFR